MSTQAYSAYGSQIRIGDGVSPGGAAITGATNTTPIIITAPSHGIVDVSYGTVTGVGGNTGANGSWIVERVSATQLRLKNSVGNGTYTSGGVITIASTFAYVVELTNVEGAGSTADTVDTSAHDGNGYSSQVTTLKRTNQMQLTVNLVPGNPTHDEDTGLLHLYNTGERRDVLLVLPPYPVTGQRSVGHLYGAVSYYTENLPVAGVVVAQFTLAFDGAFDFAA